MAAGIVGYGIYLPALRISIQEYQKAWGSAAARIKEKRVPDFDEDSLTMGVEAARKALSSRPDISRDSFVALAFASTCPPYHEKVEGGSMATALGLPKYLYNTEHSSSTRAGVEALLSSFHFLKACDDGSPDSCGLAVVADAPQAPINQNIEHGLGAGAAAFILGKKGAIAEIEGEVGFVSERLGERFWRTGEAGIADIGVAQYTGDSFRSITVEAGRALMQKLGRKADDYQYVVISEHDGRLPGAVATRLGFAKEKVDPGSLYNLLGDTGAASPLLSLAATLDVARPGERILVIAYGSGAAAQAISLAVTEEKEQYTSSVPVKKVLEEEGKLISFVEYLKITRRIV